MVNQKRWKVTNITVRQPRVDPTTKQDLRTAIERVGYNVSWKEEKDPNCTVLGPSQLRIVSRVTDGMIALANDGLLKIEEFGDIGDVLQTHASTGKRVQRRGVKGQAAPMFAEQEPSALQAAGPRGRREARAAEMGQDNYAQKGGVEHEGAMNPSGDPNFVARAPSYETRKKMKRNA